MAVRIAGKQMYLWRAVDDEGEVLDVLVQRRRDKHAARKLMRIPPAKDAGQVARLRLVVVFLDHCLASAARA